MLFIERHQGLRLFFAVIFMLFLDFFHVRLNSLHQHLLFRAGMEERVEDEPDHDRYENDGEAEIVKCDRLIENRSAD